MLEFYFSPPAIYMRLNIRAGIRRPVSFFAVIPLLRTERDACFIFPVSFQFAVLLLFVKLCLSLDFRIGLMRPVEHLTLLGHHITDVCRFARDFNSIP